MIVEDYDHVAILRNRDIIRRGYRNPATGEFVRESEAVEFEKENYTKAIGVFDTQNKVLGSIGCTDDLFGRPLKEIAEDGDFLRSYERIKGPPLGVYSFYLTFVQESGV